PAAAGDRDRRHRSTAARSGTSRWHTSGTGRRPAGRHLASERSSSGRCGARGEPRRIAAGVYGRPPERLRQPVAAFRLSPMPYLELTLRCREAEQPRYENALDDVGALAVTMIDADADTDEEHAILEPGVGETPLWDSIALSALFPHDADALVLLAALEAFDPGLDWSRAAFRRVEDQDWERAWMDQYQPL